MFNKGFHGDLRVRAKLGNEKNIDMPVSTILRQAVEKAEKGEFWVNNDWIEVPDSAQWVIKDSSNKQLVNLITGVGFSPANKALVLETANNKELIVTPDMEFYCSLTDSENAKNFKVGDSLVQASGELIEIVRITELEEPFEMLWLETSSNSFDLGGFRAWFRE